jgi:hypothetical protein
MTYTDGDKTFRTSTVEVIKLFVNHTVHNKLECFSSLSNI